MIGPIGGAITAWQLLSGFKPPSALVPDNKTVALMVKSIGGWSLGFVVAAAVALSIGAAIERGPTGYTIGWAMGGAIGGFIGGTVMGLGTGLPQQSLRWNVVLLGRSEERLVGEVGISVCDVHE